MSGAMRAISVPSASWHPAVETCEITDEDGTTYRILTLGDGAQLKERHDGATASGYSYTIIEGPLPVKDYSSTFEAVGDADEHNHQLVIVVHVRGRNG